MPTTRYKPGVAVAVLDNKIYKSGQQTWPSDFRAIFEALRQLTTSQIIFYLFPLGLRILKWGETSL